MLVTICSAIVACAKSEFVEIAKKLNGALFAKLTIVWVAGISQTVLVVTQSFAKNVSHRAMNIRSATNVEVIFAMVFAQNMKYQIVAIAALRVAVMPVRRMVDSFIRKIGLLVRDAAIASVTIVTRRKAYYTQFKHATVVTRATVVIAGNLLRLKRMMLRSKRMILRAKRTKKTRIVLDVSN
mmetsp:Transcript_7587/g.11519  ORF Transcript_7587/g.11519 Transcript_7587/m.11519 type:complete len:182 (+) Transcript_7587:353-898(+)|eukprot:scaffold2901_cov91-Skeletonema_dohrnii-CCMP3373.AAC.22